jgi:hypothetical protein
MENEVFVPAGLLARARVPDELFDEIFEIKLKEKSSEA